MRSSILTAAFGIFALTSGCGSHQARSISDDAPHYLPVPDFAKSLPLNSDGYAVEYFGKGTYMITDGAYNSIFLVSKIGVIVVDLPPTTGHKLFWAIGNITNLPITHLVYSHMHADHVGGVYLIEEKYNVTTIAHVDTADQLAFIKDPNRPVPQITFSDCYTLTVGNQTLELSYKGENHLRGNIFIYAPKPKVLMLVDVIYPRWTPFSQLGEAKYLPGYIKAHDQVLAYDFEHFVGGHLGFSGNRSDVLVAKEYVGDLKRNCEKAIQLSATNDPVLGVATVLGPVSAANLGNPWANFIVYIDATTNWCVEKTNEKWLHRLAAADIWQYDNAKTMIESLRIDFGILGPFSTV